MSPLMQLDEEDLRRKMTGTTAVPAEPAVALPEWGDKCKTFLDAVRNHNSKASTGFYYTTHIDYFDKIFRSIRNLAKALRAGGTAFLVVQDSYYKEVHND